MTVIGNDVVQTFKEVHSNLRELDCLPDGAFMAIEYATYILLHKLCVVS